MDFEASEAPYSPAVRPVLAHACLGFPGAHDAHMCSTTQAERSRGFRHGSAPLHMCCPDAPCRCSKSAIFPSLGSASTDRRHGARAGSHPLGAEGQAWGGRPQIMRCGWASTQQKSQQVSASSKSGGARIRHPEQLEAQKGTAGVTQGSTPRTGQAQGQGRRAAALPLPPNLCAVKPHLVSDLLEHLPRHLTTLI